MHYELESISQKDIEKILIDSQCDPEINKQIEVAIKSRLFTNKWAVDRLRNSYLIAKPIFIGMGEVDVEYYIFVDNKFYLIIHVNGRLFSVVDKFRFGKDYNLDSSDIENVKQSSVKAFEAYGRYGFGPLNLNGKPTDFLIPTFDT